MRWFMVIRLLLCPPSYRSDLPDRLRQIIHGFCLKMTPCPWRFFASLEHLRLGGPIRCRIQSMVPEKRGWIVCSGEYRNYSRCFWLLSRELNDETLEILVNRAETIAHMIQWARCQDLFGWSTIKFIRNVGFYPLELGIKRAWWLRIRDSRQYPWGDSKVEAKGQEVCPISMRLVSWPSRWKRLWKWMI